MLTSLRFASAFIAIALFTPSFDSVQVEYRSELSYEYRGTRTATKRLVEAKMTVNDQELPPDAWNPSNPDEDQSRTIIYRDVVGEVADGRPLAISREFVELSNKETKDGETSEESGALEGLTLELSRDDDEVVAKIAGDSDHDIHEGYLADHFLESPIAAILPEDEVDPGESWEPDSDALQQFLYPRGASYFDPESDDSFGKAIREYGEFSGHVTYNEMSDLNGEKCFILEVNAELEADVSELPEQLRGSGPGEAEGNIQVEGEFSAKIWISVESKFPVRIEGESEMNLKLEMNTDSDGMALKMSMEFEAESTMETEWEVLDSE